MKDSKDLDKLDNAWPSDDEERLTSNVIDF